MLAAPVLALVLGAMVAMSGFRGSDWPAHLFRIELFRQAGMTLWNGQWYGGHYTLGYSVVFPPLAAWFGPLVVGFVSSLVATTCFMLLLRRRYGNTGALAACWVAVGTAINLSVGRLPFALGLAFGLAALLAYDRGRIALAVLAALMTPLASPVAGTFLALAAGGVVVDLAISRHRFRRARHGDGQSGDAQPGDAPPGDARSRDRRPSDRHIGPPLAIGVASIAPVVATAVLFPDPGVFPFRAAGFAGVVVSLVGLIVVLPPSERVLRISAGLGVLASVPLFMVANPLGGNMTRLVVLFVVPIMGAVMWKRRPEFVIVAAIPLAVWMVLPGVAGATRSDNPSSAPEYHEPVVEFVQRAGGPAGRVEIPFTDDHWEVAFVAASIPIARGWERQVDMDRNAVLYDESLSVTEYRRWIDDNAVRWVALPDVVLDEGGKAEAALIERGIPWLDLVETTQHWQIFEVVDARPIVEAPGRLVRESPDELVIDVDRAGSVIVRTPYMPYWTVDEPDGNGAGAAASAAPADVCITRSADGLLEVIVSKPGVVTLRPEFSLDPVFGTTTLDECEASGDSLDGQDVVRVALR